jgi:hypothetical protein
MTGTHPTQSGAGFDDERNAPPARCHGEMAAPAPFKRWKHTSPDVGFGTSCGVGATAPYEGLGDSATRCWRQ